MYIFISVYMLLHVCESKPHIYDLFLYEYAIFTTLRDSFFKCKWYCYIKNLICKTIKLEKTILKIILFFSLWIYIFLVIFGPLRKWDFDLEND